MTVHTREVSRHNIQDDVNVMLRGWIDGSKHVIAHYLSPIEFREYTSFTGTDKELLEWIENFPHKVGAIYVVSDHDLVYDMWQLRPNLVFTHVKVIE